MATVPCWSQRKAFKVLIKIYFLQWFLFDCKEQSIFVPILLRRAFIFFNLKTISVKLYTVLYCRNLYKVQNIWSFGYLCITVFLTAVLNWIKIVCMYTVAAVPTFFFVCFPGARMTSLSAARPLRLTMSKILISKSQAAAPKTRWKSQRMSRPNTDFSVYSEVPFLPSQRFLMKEFYFSISHRFIFICYCFIWKMQYFSDVNNACFGKFVCSFFFRFVYNDFYYIDVCVYVFKCT